MDFKRRDFLKKSLVGLGSVTLGTSSSISSSANEIKSDSTVPFSTDPLATVQILPNVQSSRIGFGTGMRGGMRSCELTRMEHEKSVNLINYAYDRGIRFFDCADMYGSHNIVSSTLKDKPRDSYVLATKIWLHKGGLPEDERPRATVSIKRFLQELKTDYLDIVQLHCMMTPNWEDDFSQYMEDLEQLKKEGVIRGHGVSTHSFEAMKKAAVNPWVDAMHIRLNSTGARMDGSFEENVEVAKQARANGKGIICMKLIGEGTIKDLEERRRTLDMVVNSQVTDVYIVGFTESWQIDEFIDNMELSLKTFANK